MSLWMLRSSRRLRDLLLNVKKQLEPQVISEGRNCYSETVVLKVFSDFLEAADHGQLTLLVLLDLSAAFDTVDHDIFCQRLQSSFGFDEPGLNWLRCYLNGLECQIRIGLLREFCLSAAFLRDRFSVQPSSQYILRTCQESSPAMGCGHTSMPTIRRFLVIAKSIHNRHRFHKEN